MALDRDVCVLTQHCAESLASERRELLLQFRSAAEDVAYGASDEAKLLFAHGATMTACVHTITTTR